MAKRARVGTTVHEIIGSANGQEWLSRWKQVRGLVTPSALRKDVTQSFDEPGTDWAGSGIYSKDSSEESETRYDIVNAWQANYVRGRCALDGSLLDAALEPYSDEDLFRDFYSERPGSRVLDVGCNTGKNLARAVRYGGKDTEVWGIEYSEDSVRIAQAAHGADRIVQGDASGDFAAANGWEGKFTVVQCTAVLQHLTPQQVESAIGTMARCLRPGGELLLTFKDAPTEEQLQKMGMDVWGQGVFTADLAAREQYLRDGHLRAVMWDDDYYPGITSTSPPAERDFHLPGIHRRAFVFYSLDWMKARAAEHGLAAEDVQVCPDSKIPYSALHWKVVFRAAAEAKKP